jgi:hypothetical protein
MLTLKDKGHQDNHESNHGLVLQPAASTPTTQSPATSTVATTDTTAPVGSYDKITFFHRGAAGLVPAGAAPPPLTSTKILQPRNPKPKPKYLVAPSQKRVFQKIKDPKPQSGGNRTDHSSTAQVPSPSSTENSASETSTRVKLAPRTVFGRIQLRKHTAGGSANPRPIAQIPLPSADDLFMPRENLVSRRKLAQSLIRSETLAPALDASVVVEAQEPLESSVSFETLTPAPESPAVVEVTEAVESSASSDTLTATSVTSTTEAVKSPGSPETLEEEVVRLRKKVDELEVKLRVLGRELSSNSPVVQTPTTRAASPRVHQTPKKNLWQWFFLLATLLVFLMALTNPPGYSSGPAVTPVLQISDRRFIPPPSSFVDEPEYVKGAETFMLNESVTSSAVLNTTSKYLRRNEVFSTALATTYREAGGFKTAATLSFGMTAILALLRWGHYLNKLR